MKSPPARRSREFFNGKKWNWKMIRKLKRWRKIRRRSDVRRPHSSLPIRGGQTVWHCITRQKTRRKKHSATESVSAADGGSGCGSGLFIRFGAFILSTRLKQLVAFSSAAPPMVSDRRRPSEFSYGTREKAKTTHGNLWEVTIHAAASRSRTTDRD